MPHFVSVTYGAGGSTRDLTHGLVERIQHTTKLDPIPHLTCVCHNEEEIEAILLRYAQSAIGNVLALGGDRPVGIAYDKARDSFQHAIDLVKFIRRFNESGAHPDRRGFGIGVAGFPEGHPATPNRLLEMDHLKAKVDAGADYIVTQLFFDNRDFYDFRERCELAGIRIPIIAGIMPITSMSGCKRIAELAGGARFPAKLLRALQRCEDDPKMVTRDGAHSALEQCHDLLDNRVAGIHFYTLNKSDATRTIFDSLGIPRRQSAEISASTSSWPPTSSMAELRARCVIVGGGPAGMMTGYLLARAGVEVAVLEKHADFNRDFRGDTIHPSTLELMHELGLLEEFLKLPHQELSRLRGVINGHYVSIADFSRLPTRCKFIAFMPQWDFLNFFAAKAKEFPSFALHLQHEVVDLLFEGNRVAGARAKTPEGERDIYADLVIGADGR